MPLPLLSDSTVLLTDENSLPNCSLNHFSNHLPVNGKCKLGLVFRVFYHLEACFLGRELPPVLFRIELVLVEQRFAVDERGGLPLVEADFKAELLHVHQLLEQRKPLLGFLDDGFQE